MAYVTILLLASHVFLSFIFISIWFPLTDLEYTILFRANVYVKIYNDNTIRTSPSVYYYSFDIHYKWAAYTGTQNGIDIFNFDIHTYAM